MFCNMFNYISVCVIFCLLSIHATQTRFFRPVFLCNANILGTGVLRCTLRYVAGTIRNIVCVPFSKGAPHQLANINAKSRSPALFMAMWTENLWFVIELLCCWHGFFRTFTANPPSTTWPGFASGLRFPGAGDWWLGAIVLGCYGYLQMIYIYNILNIYSNSVSFKIIMINWMLHCCYLLLVESCWSLVSFLSQFTTTIYQSTIAAYSPWPACSS